MLHRFLPALILASLTLSACSTMRPIDGPTPVDENATRQTRALYANLHKLSGQTTLFGQEDAFAYGVDWRAEPGDAPRSDMSDVSGSFPAVMGFDIGGIALPGRTFNVDNLEFDDIRTWIQQAHAMGAVVTLSWHAWNPVSGGNSWDQTPAVTQILPGGERHEQFIGALAAAADFMDSLRDREGQPIPIIFRPWHESTGSWFWWGSPHATDAEIQELYRMTADYLRQDRGLHHLLYAYSPQDSDSLAHYLRHYPGDDYVDVLGFDEYHQIAMPTADTSRVELVRKRIRVVTNMARMRGKLAALTEAGYETIPDPTWWTGRLLPTLQDIPEARYLSYVMVWRNTNTDEKPDHYYVPYPGHPSADDFVRFLESPGIWTLDELPNLYR